jgi:tetratricopeptide (TPR) repeat protein
VRKTLGVTAFGINAYTAADAGDLVVEEHDETRLGHEEVYVVVRGHATFTVDGDQIDAPAGTLVYLDDPAQTRTAIAREPGTTVLAIGGKPGLHEVSAWEYFFPALPLLDAGRWQEARPLIEEGLAAKPDHPALLLFLARCEAHLGETDAAREHAAGALAQEPGFRRFAEDDEALAALLPAQD